MKDYIEEQEDQPNPNSNQLIKYARAPPKNANLRMNDRKVALTSNLMKLTFTET